MIQKKCVNKQENEEDCPCVDDYCEGHGICCECLRHHKNKGGLPACLR